LKNLFWVSLCFLLIACTTNSSDKMDLANEYLLLAETYYNLENYEKSIGLYEKSLTYGNNTEIYYNLTLACINAKDFSRAEIYLDFFSPDQKNTVLYKEVIGFFELSRKEYSSALITLQDLYSKDKTKPSIIDNLILLSILLDNPRLEEKYKFRKWELSGSTEDLLVIFEFYKDSEKWDEMEVLLVEADSGHSEEFSLYWALVYRKNSLYQESLNSINLWLNTEEGRDFEAYLLKLAVLVIDLEDYENAYVYIEENKLLFEKNKDRYKEFFNSNSLSDSGFVIRIEEQIFNADL